uniref:Uncharacterized protein n=1 Tax=Meloidogyne incognita TaxID=6306 RepID=A0A914LUE4_MELIC
MTANSFTKAQYKLDDPVVPVWDDDKQLEMGFDAKTEGLTFRQRRRLQERNAWNKYWEVREKESRVSRVFFLNFGLLTGGRGLGYFFNKSSYGC